jgi:hypothetical protein
MCNILFGLFLLFEFPYRECIYNLRESGTTYDAATAFSGVYELTGLAIGLVARLWDIKDEKYYQKLLI